MKFDHRYFFVSLAFFFAFLLVSNSHGWAQSAQDSAPPSTEQATPESKDSSADSDNEKQEQRSPSSKRRNRTASRNQEYSKNTAEFVDLFDGITGSAASSTVQIFNGTHEIALGTIVDSEGFVLTKASELKGDLQCRLRDGSSISAKVFGVDPDTDLALLKIEKSNLPVVNWSEAETPTIGQWVATPNAVGRPLRLGVVSVNVRPIPPGGGFLGILPTQARDKPGVRITQVTAGKPASKAGLLVNDVIIKIDNEDINTVLDLRETLKNYSEGDRIDLTIQRGDEELVLPLRLSDSQKENPMFNRSNTQNRMGSTLSRRRLDFPMAFQHDSHLQAKNCGGPIVDLSGRVVGINIARAGRVKSFALPVQTVLPIIQQLKTGEYSPAVVNKERITEVEAELKSLEKKLVELPERQKSLESLLTANNARKEELEKTIKLLQERLEKVEESAKDKRDELKKITGDLESAQLSKESLQKERNTLTTGKR